MPRAFPILSALLLVLMARSDTVAPRQPVKMELIPIALAPVHLNADRPATKRVGKLEWVSGWHLIAKHHRFGGISALLADKGQFTALSDLGALYTFSIDAAGKASPVAIAPLPEGCGKRRYKSDQDSESLARATADGPIWLGLEVWNQICRVSADAKRHEAILTPKAMRGWSHKNGAEAMTWLKDGRLAVFAESDPQSSSAPKPVALFSGDPTVPKTKVEMARYMSPKGFRPVDAATLPDGRVLVLNRRFGLPYSWAAVLVIVDPRQFRAGAVIRGKEIARFVPPLIIDNFEAIAVETTKDATHIWIASDDNFMFLQRNLLLKFKLID